MAMKNLKFTKYIQVQGAKRFFGYFGLFLILMGVSSCASLHRNLSVSTMNDLDYGMSVEYADLSNEIKVAYSIRKKDNRLFCLCMDWRPIFLPGKRI